MSKRSRSAQRKAQAAGVQQDIPYLAVELRRRVKIAGDWYRSRTILADLETDLRAALLASGAAVEVEVEVLIPADGITDGDVNPVDPSTVEIVGSDVDAGTKETTNPSGTTDGAEGETA